MAWVSASGSNVLCAHTLLQPRLVHHLHPTQPHATHPPCALRHVPCDRLRWRVRSPHLERHLQPQLLRSSSAASPSSSPFSPLPFAAAPPPGSDPLSALGVDTQCAEKRIFYRLISGMHASISAHISANYLLDEDAGLWGHNLADFK